MAEKNYWIHIKQGDFELDVEGDRNFVESYVKTFLEEETPKGGDRRTTKEKPAVKKAARKPSRAAKKAAKTTSKAAEPAKKASEIPKVTKEELKKFLKGKSVKSLRDRYLLCSQYWTARGVKEFTNEHIVACSKAAGYPDTASGRQYFSILTRQGLMKHGSKRGQWMLTPAGTEEKVAGKSKAKAKTTKKTKKKAKAKVVKKVKAKPGRKPGKHKTPKTLDEVLGPA